MDIPIGSVYLTTDVAVGDTVVNFTSFKKGFLLFTQLHQSDIDYAKSVNKSQVYAKIIMEIDEKEVIKLSEDFCIEAARKAGNAPTI